MKKFIMILAAMICLTGCMTSSVDAIYSLKMTWLGRGYTTLTVDGTSPEAAEEAYDKINDKIKAFRNQYEKDKWIETIRNGKYSKADKNAKALYNTAARSLDDLQKECDDIVKNIPSGLAAEFEIKYKLVVSRFAEAKDTVLEEKAFSVEYN